jgi:hypothetical protein
MLLHLRSQRKFPCRYAVRIPQREDETPQAVVAISAIVLAAFLPSFLPSFLFHSRDSHFIGVKPLKTFPAAFRINVRVFARSSQQRWSSAALKPSRVTPYSSANHFALNSSNGGRKSPTISESTPEAVQLFSAESAARSCSIAPTSDATGAMSTSVLLSQPSFSSCAASCFCAPSHRPRSASTSSTNRPASAPREPFQRERRSLLR